MSILNSNLPRVRSFFLVLILPLFSISLIGQVDYDQGFDGCNLNPCNSWGWSDISGLITAIPTSGYSPCAVGDPAAAIILNGTTTSAILAPTVSLGVSTGEPIHFEFDYKVVNVGSGSAAAANSATFEVEWASSTAGPWTSVGQFNNESSTSCDDEELPVFFVPIGTNIFVRINVSRSTGSIWAVVDNIALDQAPTAVSDNTECMCNNDASLNTLDGTFNSFLTIIYPGADMPMGLDYTLTAATGLMNLSGGPIGMPNLIHCQGPGCPTGITAGHYYLPVQVVPAGMFTAAIDGPDPDAMADPTLAINSSCGIAYPAIPSMPFAAQNCLDPGLNVFTTNADVIVNQFNVYDNIMLPTGISQTSPTEITVDDDVFTEADNEPDGINFYLQTTDAGTGCISTAFANVEIFNDVNPELQDVYVECRRPRENDTIYLSTMFTANNTGDGEFTVGGVVIPGGKYGIDGDECVDVTYTIMDNCGNSESDTKNLLITFSPAAAFDFSNAANAPVSPECSDSPVMVDIVRTSTSDNFQYLLSSDNASYTPTISGSTLTLPNPGIGESVSYEICLTEENVLAPACGSLTAAIACADTLCKTFVVYRDKSDCGANALFENTCDIRKIDVCEADNKGGLEIGCSFITFETPDILTADVTFDSPIAECDVEMITGSYNVSFFGIDGNLGGSGQTLGSFPGISVVCDVLNFKVLGWRPLGALYNILGCDKTIAQFLLDILGKIAGGDGGGAQVVADTDGDGAFDFLIEEGSFPLTGSFTIPNNLDGPGYITVRAVGGWVNSPKDVCGDFGVEGVNLLDLLPIGAIPIVGAVIEDILASASCNVNIALANSDTQEVLVGNNEAPTFLNCNPEGYTFAQTLDCDFPVNWSIPVASDGCTAAGLDYKGITDMVDVSDFPGTAPTPVMIDEPGIYQTAGPITGSDLTPGVYPVTYLAVSCNGLPTLCTFNVTVTAGDPILEAPNDLTIYVDQDLCTAEANGLSPYQGVGCASIINYAYTSPVTNTPVETTSTTIGEHNIPDGNTFELGNTEIVYTMLVDINGDGDYADPQETQLDTFNILVVDNQRPDAVCVDVSVQLDNTGSATVFSLARALEVYIDGGSTDNCGVDSVLISRDNMTFQDSVDFDCADKGTNIVSLKVVDDNGNESFCSAVVTVIDFFEGFKLDLDVPEICFEPFQNSIDFSPYIVIAEPTGTNISHQNVGTLGPEVFGVFGISAFLPDPGSSNDPGTITTDGVYTIGTGTGYITISYILAIEEQINQIDDTEPLTGCFRMVHDVFRVEKLDPVWDGGFICCDQTPVWLGGASWDGTGAPPIPPGFLSLTDIRGSYPGDVEGEWTGDGVSFVDPDGVNFSGDEFFQFDPSGFDQSVTLTYTIGDEPCIFDYSQEILVTCQDLQIALGDTTVCPATLIDERVIEVNLNDDDLVVSTTGLAAAGGSDLTDVPVVDGMVIIPGFTTVAVRNETFVIGVTVNQTSAFGCLDFFTYSITVKDTIPPFFQNCPKEPIIVEALPDLCENFVNFEDPWADDNCFSLYTDIQQVDTTGLVSGDSYPVGTTMLAYTATDTVGNQSYCELKIVVNDYQQDPSIVCPDDVMEVNDLGKCSAVIDDLPPVEFADNCPNNTITYEAKDEDGNVLYCGFENASGNIYPVGKTTVEYKISDQSLILITEIVQDGATTGIEITNFGPSAMDITCAQVAVFDAAGIAVDTFLIPTPNNKSTELVQVDFPPLPTIWQIPSPNNLSVGEAWTYDFATNVPLGVEARYEFKFLDRIIDEVTVNDEVTAAVFLRETVCDHDTQTDFIPATPCDPGSYGVINPGLPTMTDNGLESSIQAFDANTSTCSFDVVVDDIEAPVCIMHDSVEINAGLNMPIDVAAMMCATSDVVMPDGIVNDVNVNNLLITTANVADLTVYLNSPSGTRILLFDGLCDGTADVDVTFDETDGLINSPSITTAPCGPLGQGGIYTPEESVKAFFGEPAGGTWQLEMYTSGATTAQIVDWDLQILNEDLYAQQDTILTNDTMVCNAEFTWIHPVFRDNCCEGEMTVEYAFSNDVTGVSYTEDGVIQTADGSVNIDGTMITKVFEVGVTVITYTLIDQYGNQSQCGFTVTVLDDEVPMFPNGCRNWTVGLDGGECYGALPRIPDAEDNCALDTITFCDQNGLPIDIYRLPIGVNTITMKAIDIYGNIGTCIFDVVIVENVPANNSLSCNNQINLSLGPDCMAEVNADMMLEGSDHRCYENYTIVIEDEGGVPHANKFDLSDVGQTFKVTIIDSQGSSNSCWGYITIEEKLIPEFECPRDTILYCNIDPDAVDNFGRLLTGELKLLSCVPNVEVTYQDHLENNGVCATPRAKLVRKWRVDDGKGNILFCDQMIEFRSFEYDQITWPEDFFGPTSISCKDVHHDPTLTTPDNTGYPKINDNKIFGKHFCDVNVGFWDEVLQDANCISGYEILRHWVIRNECEPLVFGVNPRVHIQSIKVDDKTAPILLSIPDVTVTTDPWTCRGSYKLPDFVHADDCSGYKIDWYSSYGLFNDTLIYNLLKGRTTVTAFVFDHCGNSGSVSFTITTLDKTAPVAIAKKDIVVSLTPGANGDGSAKLYTDAFDNHSFDNCTDVHVEIRRKEAPDCTNLGLNGYNNNNTYDNTGHIDDNPMDTDAGQFVKFCCEDLSGIVVDANNDGIIDSLDRGYVQVFMRVWDDGNMSNVYGDEVNGHTDNFNETWTFVRVEDKLPPVLTCPDDATIFCDWGIDMSTDFPDEAVQGGWVPLTAANFDKTGLAEAFSTCGTEAIEFKDTDQTDKCGVGTIVRQFRTSSSSKTGPKVVVCQQVITVLARPTDFAVIPPVKNPIIIDECTLTPEIIEAARNNPSLANRFPRVSGGVCDVIGENIKIDTFLFEDGVCKKWRVQFSYYNWCDHEEFGPYDVIFFYDDTEKPEITMCQDTMYGVDAECQHILTVSNSATDGGGCVDGGWLKWQVFVDTWGDGKIDHYGSFYRSESRWTRIARYLANGSENPAWTALPAGQDYADYVWVKNVGATSSGGAIELEIEKEVIEGKMSNHKVHWKVTDGCHNFASCSQEIMVVDKKAPTPYCINVSSALMDAGSIEIWARDFDNGSFDNCTPQEDLLFTFGGMHPVLDKIDEEHFFTGAGVESTQAAYNNGDAQKWLPAYKSSSKIFDCDEFNAQTAEGVLVSMTVWDKKFNNDFCIVNLKLVDNHNACSGDGSRIAGSIHTESGEPLMDVTIQIDGDINDLTKLVVVDGEYAFNSLPKGVNYTLTSTKDVDYMNGVSTLDLILIQRHILGIQNIETAYKMVAADVNDDKRIRTGDLVELRKLILGITDDLPMNTSWKMLKASTPMTMTSPLAYEESILISNLQSDWLSEDFIAVKIGDVNGSAKANLRSLDTEPRSNKKIALKAEDATLVAGQNISIAITSDNFKEVFGYQFTMVLNGLTYTGVRSGAIEMTADNVGMPQEGVVTTSWASDQLVSVSEGETLFTLEFTADKSSNLKDMIALTSDVTSAESYLGSELNLGSIDLTFRSEEVEALYANALYQNEPNPFKDITTIAYDMAAAGTATFTLYDVTGKVLLVKSVETTKGKNSIEFRAEDIAASGIVYYQIESGDFTATRKMLIVE